MSNMRLVENAKIVVGAVPIDTTGAAVAGDYVSLKGYSHLTIVIMQGAWAGGTPAVTLLQATDVAATGAKALSFTKYWSGTALTADLLTANTVTSDTYNLTATANKFNVIEVDASSLDVDGGFDCVRVGIATPGSNADLIAVLYILTGPRYPQASPPSAIID
jgi:hypothetical protein